MLKNHVSSTGCTFNRIGTGRARPPAYENRNPTGNSKDCPKPNYNREEHLAKFMEDMETIRGGRG